jgi:hypothetical protein
MVPENTAGQKSPVRGLVIVEMESTDMRRYEPLVGGNTICPVLEPEGTIPSR